MAILRDDPSSNSFLPTRKINVPIDSRYGSTPLIQVTDDSRRRGTTAGRRLLDISRNLGAALQNKVNKRLNTFVWGVWKQIPVPSDSDDIIYSVIEGQNGRLDLIAVEFYGNPNFWWVLAQENAIKDPLQDLPPGTKLRIPSYQNVMSTALESVRQGPTTAIEAR